MMEHKNRVQLYRVVAQWESQRCYSREESSVNWFGRLTQDKSKIAFVVVEVFVRPMGA